MNEERCICCGKTIPEGKQVCWSCEHRMIKAGAILQSRNATEEEVAKAYIFFRNKGGKL
jgi:ribosomal protein S26